MQRWVGVNHLFLGHPQNGEEYTQGGGGGGKIVAPLNIFKRKSQAQGFLLWFARNMGGWMILKNLANFWDFQIRKLRTRNPSTRYFQAWMVQGNVKPTLWYWKRNETYHIRNYFFPDTGTLGLTMTPKCVPSLGGVTKTHNFFA